MNSMHGASPSYPPPPQRFPQNSVDTTMNGIHNSHSALNSFDGPQSMGSTPTPTPPASRHQQNMSFNAPFANMNGSFSQQNTPRHHHNPKQVTQQQYLPGQKPQIYTAVYSGVQVYEMETNSVAIMRRRKDSWLNATQILKVAGVEKGKRTKILEKEILNGEHEKVQGGYGRYQGTWINYPRGVDFARQYGVEELLRPLLEYDMGQEGYDAGHGNIETPTKEQAMAANRKRNMMNGGTEGRAPAQSPNGTFFKNISKSAANAVTAISKARFDTSGSRPSGVNRPTKLMRQNSQQLGGSQDSAYAGSSQQSMQSLQSDNSFSASQIDPALRTDTTPYYPNVNTYQQAGDMNEPPRKRVRPTPSQDSFLPAHGDLNTSMTDMTPTGNNASFSNLQEASQHTMDYTKNGLQPLPQPTSNSATEKQQLLTSLFVDPTQTDFSQHPALLRLSGEDLDMPIDQTAHTALHWAATLARTTLLRTLVEKGANIYRTNGGGETALIRAALTTNNLDQGSFPELLEILGPTIEIRDGRGRTVLHHIAVSSAVKGRGSAARYYLESLLEFLVRSGSAANSQQNSFLESTVAPVPKSIGLAKFIAEVVDLGDISGDTALNLSARIGNKAIIKQLIEVGADPTKANRSGLRPIDFGINNDTGLDDLQSGTQLAKTDKSTGSKVTESSQELMNTLSTLLSDSESSFRSEMQAKQSLIDESHVKLRESTNALANERRALHELQRKSADRKARNQRITNLKIAIERKRNILANRNGVKPSDIRTDIKVGEADAGLEIDAELLGNPTEPGWVLTPERRAYLATLPSAAVLNARATAYRKHNARLEEEAKQLQGQSSVLEGQLRKIVSLCCNVEESKVDEMVGKLSTAIASEGAEDVETGRIREFLRKVEENED